MKKAPCDPQVGADIEVFLYDKEKRHVIPCVGVINGTKDKPFKPEGYVDGFALQEDNVMLEYNIPPARTEGTWYKRFQVAKQMMRKHLPAGYSWRTYPEHKFRPKDLISPQAKVIGCEPDFDAYEGGEIRSFCDTLGLERSCGGHIHLGGNFNCPDFIAALFADLCIGVFAGTGPDQANSRTAWYGKPGIFRPKPYGVEYRTPDNRWTKNSDKVQYVGMCSLSLATWLTMHEAAVIRGVFKAINWSRVRDYLSPACENKQQLYKQISVEAQEAGVPIG